MADSGKRKKKGNELEQIDCTPPEHILPGSKERPLVPLQPQNKDWKVRSCRVSGQSFHSRISRLLERGGAERRSHQVPD